MILLLFSYMFMFIIKCYLVLFNTAYIVYVPAIYSIYYYFNVINDALNIILYFVYFIRLNDIYIFLLYFCESKNTSTLFTFSCAG